MPNFRTAAQLNGIAPLGLVSSVVSKTGAYTLGVNDGLVLADATTAAFTLTLPSAAASGAAGRLYTLKKTDSSAHAVTIATTSSQTIDGATTYTLSRQYQYVAVASDGTNWQLVDSNLLFDTTATDIQALGTQAAGASGQIADAKHVHPMPTLDQISAPAANVAMNSKKITGLANGTAATDGAAFGQIPVIDATAGDIQQLGTGAAGATGKTADAGHVHPASTAGNLAIGGDGLNIAAAGLTAIVGEVVNSTTLTTAATLTVPANEPVAGSVYEIDVFGLYGTASTNTNLTFTVNWGATSLGSNAFTMPISINTGAPGRWRFKGTISFVSTTVCYANLRLEYVASNSANTAASVFLYGSNAAAGVTVTTSSSQALALTMQWTTASSSNGFWVTGGRVWKAA